MLTASICDDLWGLPSKMLPWFWGLFDPLLSNLDPPNISGTISSKFNSYFLSFSVFLLLLLTLLFPGKEKAISSSYSSIADTLIGFGASGLLLSLDWRFYGPPCTLLPAPNLILAIESICYSSRLEIEFLEVGSWIALFKSTFFFEFAIKSGNSSYSSTLIFLLILFIGLTSGSNLFEVALCRAIIYEFC